jgi:hypothetical protein
MRGSRIWWIFGCLVALAAGVALALWQAPRTIDIPEGRPSDAGPVRPAPKRESPRPAEPAPPALAGLPPGVSAAQWAQLQGELAGRPDELRRLAEYFTFADRMQRFRTASGAERQALAEALDVGLDERLRQREMTAGEARLVKVAVLSVLMPDDAAARAGALERWQAQWAPQPDAARLAQEREFQARQAAVVGAWMARPAAQRDPKALERELEDLRRESFAAR